MATPFGACLMAGYRFAARFAGSAQGRKQTGTTWRAPMSSSRTGRWSAKAVSSRRMSSLRTGQIAALTLDASGWSATERIDATDLWLIPGGIDTHTHFEEPDPRLLEGFASGGAAAAAGGLTSVVEMPQAHPTTITPELLHQKQGLVEQHAVVDMALWGGVIGPPGQTVSDLDGMAADGAAAFKSFMASSSPFFPEVDHAQLLWAMREAARLDVPYGLHAEDHQLLTDGLDRMRAAGRKDPLAHAESRPPLVETVAVNTALLLAAETGCHVHICHVASAGALALHPGSERARSPRHRRDMPAVPDARHGRSRSLGWLRPVRPRPARAGRGRRYLGICARWHDRSRLLRSLPLHGRKQAGRRR